VQQKAVDPRIDRMFGKDRMWAIVALIAVWVLYTFVFYFLMPHINDEGVMAVLLVSGGLVMLFNAVAIYAMIKHYSEDKTHIYGLDLHYLDIMNQRKR
jgi:ABC-type polysaccharide/polyol phosphate export permease